MSDIDILRSKLRPAPLAQQGIVRTRLIERLAGPDAPPLVVLHAPAGYGKTFLLAQAFHECQQRGSMAAWVSLDETEGNAAAFVAYLHAAFAESGLDGAIPRSGATPDVVELLIKIERVAQPFYFFLDDFQRCAGPETDRLLSYLVSRAPANLRIILATRERPRIGLAALRVKQLADIIDSLALAFDEDEYLDLRAAQVLPDAAEDFLRKAEGWPAMLALAQAHTGLIAGRQMDASVSIPAVSEYLEQEVLAHVPPEWRAALLRISILDEVIPELFTLLSSIRENWMALEALSSQNQIVRRMNAQTECYRLHPLIRDHLHARLVRTDGALARSLHALAAEFYMDHGDDVAAARHAIQAGDVVVIERLLGHTSILRLAFKGGGTLLSMLKSVDPAIARVLPHLSFAEIYLMLLANQPRRAAEAFRKLKAESPTSFVDAGESNKFMEADALVIDTLIDAYTDNFSIEKVCALERRLLEMSSADDVLLAVLRQLKLWGEYWNGNFVAPDELSHLLRCNSSRSGAINVLIYGYLALGLCALERGNLEESEGQYRLSSDFAIRLDGLRASQTKTARMLLAEVAYERNQLERSRNLIEGTLDEVELANSWFDIYASAYLTASLLAFTESFESALAVLDRADATAHCVGLDRLGILITAQRLKLATMANEPGFAREQYEKLDGACRFDVGEEHVERLGWRITVPALMAATRFHLAMGDPQQALMRLKQIPIRLEGHRQNRRILEARLLGAIAHHRLSSWEEAAEDINGALDIAAATGMERVFIDLGPLLVAPFDWMLRRQPISPVETDRTSTLRSLFQQITPCGSRPQSGNAGSRADPRLSKREREVLLGIATGKTYKEVAAELQLSLNTVMTHRKKLYERLECNSRSRVISRARSLGLIA